MATKLSTGFKEMEIKEDASFGVVPMIKGEDGVRKFLLVKHRKGHWGFPKGHADAGESMAETAVRELAEETGIKDVKLIDGAVFEEFYEYVSKKGKFVRKTVTYFLGKVGKKYEEGLKLQVEEVLDAAWGDVGQTRERLTFPEGRELFDRIASYIDTQM
ncbi:bis(5'-nucleosyl)-tetraphosphatase [Poriferisphaera sp. WC338]|uniref:bis(5'-nucleosyl)-tetraphosphatase n=1 Tax=Poriferisphaera sp. WC338 TaxID=3425129 RepID=UPI003D816DE2